MMDKRPKQKSVDKWTIPFHKNDLINAQLNNTGKNLVALQLKYPLHYFVEPNFRGKLTESIQLVDTLE